ncbi:MAG: hypothetical protein WED85_09605 [Dehalococcoidia bacterium]
MVTAGRVPVHTPAGRRLRVQPRLQRPSLMGIIQTSYDLALGWVWGAKPSLEECITSVKAHAALL